MQRQDSVEVSRRPALEGDINTTGSVQAALANIGDETTNNIIDSKQELERYVRGKMREQIDEHGFSFSEDSINVSIRNDMTSSYGRAGWRGTHGYMSISYNAHGDKEPTERLDNTILHELLHIELMKTVGMSSHGPAFRWLASHVGLPDDNHVDCYSSEESASYRFSCENCGAKWSMKRSCKSVRQVRDNMESDDPRNNCGNCERSGVDVEGKGVLEVERVAEREVLEDELKPRFV